MDKHRNLGPRVTYPPLTFNKISVCWSLKHKSPRFVCSIAKYKANSHYTKLAVAAMIEPASQVCGERQMQYGEKGYERKFALKTILKFYPKIEPLYQGILHMRISWKRGWNGPSQKALDRKWPHLSLMLPISNTFCT